MQLTNLDRFIICALAVAITANLTSQQLSQIFPGFQIFVFSTVAVILVCWLISFAIRITVSFLTAGRYAAEALILNEKRQLLLFMHPHHKVYLPPCGSVGLFQMPHEGLKTILGQRIGLEASEYRFHPLFHEIVDNQGQDLGGDVIRAPSPFIVQTERRPQRGLLRFHYDFLYVLEISNANPRFRNNEYSPIIWADCAKVQELVAHGRAFPDVLDAYQRVLQRIQSSSQNAAR